MAIKWFKSREQKEHEAALASAKFTAGVIGQCLSDIIGNEALVNLPLSLGSLLQRAARQKHVLVVSDRELAAALILCGAHLLELRPGFTKLFDITPLGERTAKQVYHLK